MGLELYNTVAQIYTLIIPDCKDQRAGLILIIQSDFWSSPYGQTESDAYEPAMQNAQVGSKTLPRVDIQWISEAYAPKFGMVARCFLFL